MRIAFLFAALACLSAGPAAAQQPEAAQAAPVSAPMVNSVRVTGVRGLDSTPSCRAAGPIDPTAGLTMPAYVANALEIALERSGRLSPGAGVTITGELRAAELTTVGPASWRLSLALASERSPGYETTVVSPFAEAFAAVYACKFAQDAWPGAVDSLIEAVLADPRFGALLGES